MLNIILSGVVVSILTEILRKNKQKDKVMTLWTLLLLAISAALLAYWILDYQFWPTLGGILVYAGAFYAYVLRNIRGSVKKPTWFKAKEEVVKAKARSKKRN